MMTRHRHDSIIARLRATGATLAHNRGEAPSSVPDVDESVARLALAMLATDGTRAADPRRSTRERASLLSKGLGHLGVVSACGITAPDNDTEEGGQ